MKPEEVKIIQIAVGQSQEPGDILYAEVYGLGDDGKLYYHSKANGWVEE